MSNLIKKVQSIICASAAIIMLCSMAPNNLRVNYRTAPMGIDSKPYFSWTSNVGRQIAYRIQVAEKVEDLLAEKNLIFDSGKEGGSSDLQVPYEGYLTSSTKYYWRVCVWDARGTSTDWSEPATFETGLLYTWDWMGSEWIGGRQPQDNNWTDMTATVRFKVIDPKKGLTFYFHAEPEGKAWDEAYVWKLNQVDSTVTLTMSTKHYAGNTGVPIPDEGEPARKWGVNYFDPQSETNPLAVGNRIVPIDAISGMQLGGLLSEEFTSKEHELEVRVNGNTITTFIDGEKVDSRTLSGDKLRARGTIGFDSSASSARRGPGGPAAAAPQTESAVITRVSVVPGMNPVSNGSTNVFSTSFEGGANPFESGYVDKDGLHLSKMPMLPISNPAPRIRKAFNVEGKEIAYARLYVTGGSYPNPSINGMPLTFDGNLPDNTLSNVPRLIPDDGQTDQFVFYYTYDVTPFLSMGQNVIGLELGHGWNGIGSPNEWYWQKTPTNGAPRTKVKLLIKYIDGTKQTISSDGTWKTTDGPTLYDSVYSGEKYDARIAKAQKGWNTTSFNDSSWDNVTIMNPIGSYFGTGLWHGATPAYGGVKEGYKESKIIAMEAEPIIVRDIMKPISVQESYPGSGVYVFNFSQMHTGFPVIDLKGISSSKKGITLRIQSDNIIQGEGTKENPYTTFNSSQFFQNDIQIDYYTLSDDADQIWRPSYHYNGEGVIEIRGLEEVLGRAPKLEDNLLYVEIASSGFPMNSVTTDNQLLNDIANMCQWTMYNDAHAHPTDTPSREKNGWTGDGWADAEAWAINFDIVQFYRQWQKDIIASQAESGEINVVVPAPRAYGYENTPGWNSANGPVLAWDNAIFEVPLILYQYYGDKIILEESYPALEKLMNYYSKYFVKENKYSYQNVTAGMGGFAMSLAEYAAGVGAGGKNSATIINHQLLYHEACAMVEIGKLLGKNTKKYQDLADDLLRTFISEYWDEETHTFSKGTTGNLHTEQIMAVAFGMVPGSDLKSSNPAYLSGTQKQADNMKSCVKFVADGMKENGNRIGTGVYGLHYMFPMLVDYGYGNQLYEIMTGLENPAWGNILLQGGTTLQENWGGITGNHHYHSTAMTWYYQCLAGIMPTDPGYKSIRIKPFVPTVEGNADIKGTKKPLEEVAATINSARGEISSSWTNKDKFSLTVTIPGNTIAEIYVPASSKNKVKRTNGPIYQRTENGYVVYQVTCGTYTFTAPKVQ